MILVPPAVFAALIYLFVSGGNTGAPAYVIYTISAYCLTVVALRIPGMTKSISGSRAVKRLTGSRFGRRYLSDPVFRGAVGIIPGTAADLFCAVFRAMIGIRYSSVWFLSMAVYCLGLGILRLSLLLDFRRRNITAEVRSYRRTAWSLIFLSIPMGVMIAMTVLTDSGYSYPGYVIYLSAAYTFYTVIHSVVSLVRFRKLGRPVLSAAKALSFVAALMSVLGLQTAMIPRFSEDSDGFRVMMNTLTGAAVWLSVILTSVYMLRRVKLKMIRGDSE